MVVVDALLGAKHSGVRFINPLSVSRDCPYIKFGKTYVPGIYLIVCQFVASRTSIDYCGSFVGLY